MRRRLLMLCITLTAIPLFAAPCPDATFSGAKEWYGGRQPRSLTFANINNDAWPDLIVASNDNNDPALGGLTVLLGDGGKTWAVDAELVPEHRIQTFVAPDFDGDGDDDVVYFSQQRIHVLKNDGGALHGAGSFPPAHNYSVFGGLVAGDFNGDDREDFAFVSLGMELYVSRGDGTFAQRTLFPTEGRDAVAADLDGDGRDELAVVRTLTGAKGELLIFPGDAQKGLADPRVVPLTRGPDHVAAADVDGDGKLDIVVTLNARTTADIVLRAGDSQTAEVRASVLMNIAGSVNPVAADVNGDRIDDLVYYDWIFGVRVRFGGADAKLVNGDSYYVPRMASTGDIELHDVDTADVDLDGDADLAVITEYGFAILKNDGTGRFDSARFVTYILAVADFNHDGRDDILDATGIRLADATGSMAPVAVADVFPNGISWAATGDMNKDGNLDAVYFRGSGFSSGLEVRLGDGAGGLGAPGPLFLMAPFDVRDGVVADLNGDGNLDVAVVDSSKSLVRFGDGTGALPLMAQIQGVSWRLAAGDLDGDGDVDLAGGDNTVLFNDGTGKFGTPVKIAEAFWVFVEIADMNGDGRLDLVGSSSGGSVARVTVHLNRGGGSFELAAESAVPTGNLNGILVRDFDRDGLLDVLLSEGGVTDAKGWMALLRGNGSGGLSAPVRMRSVSGDFILAGDFNGDGAVDISDSGFTRFGQCGGPRRRAARH